MLRFLKKRPRIVWLLYVIGLTQFVTVVLGMELVRRVRVMGPATGLPSAGFVAETLAERIEDPQAVDDELGRLHRKNGWRVVVRDDADRVVARTPEHARPPGAPPIPMAEGGQVPLVAHGHRVGTMEFSFPLRPEPPPPGNSFFYWLFGLIVFVVGASSLVAARMVTKPLSRLTTVAREFGRGRLDVRTGMRHGGELGELGRAFDDMADRIAQLVRAERDLLANVSHELRTPLARIRVALDLASDEGVTQDPKQMALSFQEIAEDLAELERLVEDVLSAARLARQEGEGTAIPLRRESLDMTALLERAVAKFESAHPERHLVARLAPSLPMVEGDAVLLRRVVDNLLDNAHKYSDKPGSRVTLSAHVEEASAEPCVIVEVTDEGIGISAEDRARLFEPFFRADRSRTRATGGLGLGLALAKRVMDAHGGAIDLTSELGRGTTARIVIPAKAT